MTQISRRPISKDIETKIYESFYKAIGLLRDQEAKLFINDLLTRTEKVMLPKRLAVAILLSKGWSYDSVRETLKVTQTTISNIERILDHSNGLRLAIEKLGKSESWRNWWQDVESLLYRLSSPGKVFMDEELIQKKISNKRSFSTNKKATL